MHCPLPTPTCCHYSCLTTTNQLASPLPRYVWAPGYGNYGYDPEMFRACDRGDVELVRAMLAAGHPADVADMAQRTPLHAAASNGSVPIAALLLEHGAKVNALTRGGDVPLHCAARAGNTAVTRELLRAKADFAAVGHAGDTPLHLACQHDRRPVARLLIDWGASAAAPNNAGIAPTALAAWHSHELAASASQLLVDELRRRLLKKIGQRLAVADLLEMVIDEVSINATEADVVEALHALEREQVLHMSSARFVHVLKTAALAGRL